MKAPTIIAIAAATKLNQFRVKKSAREIAVPRTGTKRPGVRNPSLSLRRRGTAAQVDRYVVSRATAESVAICANEPASERIMAISTWTTMATDGVRNFGCT